MGAQVLKGQKVSLTEKLGTKGCNLEESEGIGLSRSTAKKQDEKKRAAMKMCVCEEEQ